MRGQPPGGMMSEEEDVKEFEEWMHHKYPKTMFTCYTSDMKNRLEAWLAARKPLRERIKQLEAELARFRIEHSEAVDELQGWGPEDSLRIVIRRMKAKIEAQARELARLREGK